MEVGVSLLEFAQEGVVTVSPENSVQAAAELMQARSVSCLVVLEGRRPVGALTERDIVHRVVGEKRDPQKTSVREVMTAPVVTVEESLSLPNALEVMRRKGVKHLPITDERGNLCGFFTFNDLLYLLGFGLRTMARVADHERGLMR